MSLSKPHTKYNSNQRPTAIVFNGLSFIGIALCEKLLNHQVEVVCIDAFTTHQKQNAQALLSDPHFHRLKYTGSDPDFHRISRAHYIFHFVFPASSADKKLTHIISHTRVTKLLLSLAQKHSAKFALITLDYYQPDQPCTLRSTWGPITQAQQHYSFEETIRVAHSQVSEFFQKHQLDARIIHLLDVYGPNMDLSGQSGLDRPLSRLLYQAKANQPLVLDQDGLSLLYPTYIFDAARGIIQAMFSTSTTGRIFDIFTPQPITQQKFVELLKDQLSYKISISARHTLNAVHGQTGKTPSRQNIDLTRLKDSQHLIKWSPKVSLSDGLGQTIQWLENIDIDVVDFPATLESNPESLATNTLQPLILSQSSKLNTSSKPLKKSPKKARSCSAGQKLITYLLVLFLIAIISPFLSLIITTSHGFYKLSRVQKSFQEFNLAYTQKQAQAATDSFEKSFNSLTYINALLTPFNSQKFTNQLENLTHIGHSLALTTVHLSQSANLGLSASKAILDQDKQDINYLLNASQAEITQAYQHISEVSAQIQDQNTFRGTIAKPFEKIKAKLPYIKDNIATTRTLLQLLPQIIGAGGDKKVYLVLLQNNAELRPTGGFIGSFALVTFENGRLLDFIVEDVYTADGQLKGYVEPPPPIKKYLGEATWYLRDVNFDPHFPTTARQAEWFLQKELGITVDGTIGINLYVIQDILSQLESIHLSDYNEDINASNLFSRAQYHSEIDFFPGSTQKKNFLSSLAQALYLKMQDLDLSQTIKLAQALNQSLVSNQLTLSFVDDKLASAFSDLNWDGKLLASPDCQTTSCLQDFLFINDANFGVNKTNFFVKRQINYQLNIQKDGSVHATAIIDYHNTSLAETWPAGTYKNYLRLFVPKKSQLKSVIINNQKVDLDDIDINHFDNHTSIGFIVLVPIKSQAQVKINYILPQSLEFDRADQKAEYRLLVQKQSGTGPDPISAAINYPAYLRPLSILPQPASSQPQAIIFNNQLSQNQNIIIIFSR